MPKLHEILAVEKTVVSASNTIMAETAEKFGKPNYFSGYIKTLKMLVDRPENAEIEAAGSEVRAMPTNVYDTLEYALEYWSKAEDVIYQKNVSNMSAVADIYFRGSVIAEKVSVDELIGLESRLENLRKVLSRMPTLEASKEWKRDPTLGNKVWVSAHPEVTTKTEAVTIPVILYEATDKHPAQVKESTKHEVIGVNTIVHQSGAATSFQKAECLAVMDDLISEVKKARMRANACEASTAKIGNIVASLIMKPLLSS